MTSESQRLRARGATYWEAAVGHPMVEEIGAGTLPHDTFRFYFEQNVPYLHHYARAIALAIAGTSSRTALPALTRLLAQIVEVELPANLSFLERLGGRADRTAVLLPTSYAYTRHLLDAAGRGGLTVGLAALLPCQWSYGEIGQRLAPAMPADPIYADWIAMFASSGYDDLVAATTALLDAECTDADRTRTSDAFDRSTNYELAFWNMAYTRGRADAITSRRQ